MRAKRITYDWDGRGRGPRQGDVLRTKTGREWLVVASRRVASRVHPSRWALEVVAVEPESTPLGDLPWAGTRPAWRRRGPMMFQLAWAPRGPKAAR